MVSKGGLTSARTLDLLVETMISKPRLRTAEDSPRRRLA